MTIGVYGPVAGIVKLDDAGVYFAERANAFIRAIGNFILWLAPHLMRTLSVVGTAAIFLVGGGIIVHGLSGIDRYSQEVAEAVSNIPFLGVILKVMMPYTASLIIGFVVGAVLVLLVNGALRALK